MYIKDARLKLTVVINIAVFFLLKKIELFTQIYFFNDIFANGIARAVPIDGIV